MKLFVVTAIIGTALLTLGCSATGQAVGPTPTIPVPNPTAETLDSLRDQVNGSEGILRVSAIAKLEREASAEAVKILGDFFMNSSVTERYNAARALVRLDTPEARDYIRTAMADKQLTARRQAAMQALEGNGEASYAFLKTLLQDPDETVRLNTVEIIQFVETPQAQTLLQLALKDSSPAVQEAAARALEGLENMPTGKP